MEESQHVKIIGNEYLASILLVFFFFFTAYSITKIHFNNNNNKNTLLKLQDLVTEEENFQLRIDD